jgi:hypothetical protein
MFKHKEEYEILSCDVIKKINIKVQRYEKAISMNESFSKKERQKMAIDYKKFLYKDAVDKKIEEHTRGVDEFLNAMANEAYAYRASNYK